jgi:hypothetical protein
MKMDLSFQKLIQNWNRPEGSVCETDDFFYSLDEKKAELQIQSIEIWN